MIDLVNFYYEYNGEYPENKKFLEITKNTFDYLLDNEMSNKDIIKMITEKLPNKDYIEINDLPEELWENSLLKKDTFYYHKELQITSPPPTLTESFPFYLEMKIKYTEEDILKYYINTFNIREDWVFKEKEIGSIKFLLNKYKMFNFIEPVDYLLHLIDYCKSIDITPNNIYSLCEYEITVAEFLEQDINNAIAHKKNKIIWRNN